MTDPAQKVWEKISTESIKPKPRWQFLLRSSALWVFSVCSLVLGSLSVSVIIYLSVEHDWGSYYLSPTNWAALAFSAVPYFWLFFLIIFGFAAIYNFRHLEGGYRFRGIWLITGSILTSLIFGVALFRLGLGGKIDESFAHVPYYHNVVRHSCEMWRSPDDGLLTGVIVTFASGTINLKDFSGNYWVVDLASSTPYPVVNFEPGTELRIVGERDEENIFHALQIKGTVKSCGCAVGDSCGCKGGLCGMK